MMMMIIRAVIGKNNNNTNINIIQEGNLS